MPRMRTRSYVAINTRVRGGSRTREHQDSLAREARISIPRDGKQTNECEQRTKSYLVLCA
jgi:hypothetical protein